MSNNYVQVPPNSTGVKLQTFENTVGGNTVDAEAVSLVDTAGASILGTAGSANADVLTVQGISGGTPVPVSGTVTAANASVGTVGATTPTSATLVGGTNGTDLEPLTVDGSGNLKVVGTGTAGTPAGGVLTVQGASGGTVIPFNLTQVSGTNLPIGQQSVLGSLPVVLPAAQNAVGPTGATAPTTATEIGIIVGGNLVGVSSSNPVPVSNTPASGAIFEVSPTSAANTATNPFFERLTDGTTALTAAFSAYGTAPTGTEVMGVNAYITNTPAISGTVTANQGTAAANTAGWPITAGGLAESTAAWTSSTTVNTALQVNTAGYDSIVVTLNQGSTISGGVVTFEVSDTTAFTNAYTVIAILNATALSNAVGGSAYTLVASTNASFNVNVAGWAAFRVRLSTVITGTATVNVGITASAATNITSVGLVGAPTVGIKSLSASAALADNQANTNFLVSSAQANDPLAVGDWIYGGAFSGTANTALQGWSKERTSTVFKTVQATASGNTAVWTPGTGNKFRLLSVLIQITDNCATTSGGVVTISLQDGTTAMPIAVDVFVPATGVTTAIGEGLSQMITLGAFGILSATANNVLNVNLSATITGGNVRIIAMGTEE
jgi:hypothetical protein